MNLTAKKRAGETKTANKRIRREGNIPAVFYVPGEPGMSIEVDGTEFQAILRNLKAGRLSTTIFTLNLDGKKTNAIVKGIQYDLTTYDVIHLDFEGLKDDVPITVKVPVEFAGVAECVGIKLGGFLRQVIRNVKVQCLPKHIPEEFILDVRDLGVRQARRLSDIAMPDGVKPMATTDEVVVVIAKR